MFPRKHSVINSYKQCRLISWPCKPSPCQINLSRRVKRLEPLPPPEQPSATTITTTPRETTSYSDNSRLSLSFNHGVPYRTIPRYFIDDPRTYYNELDRGSVSYITGRGNWTSESRFGYNRTIQDRTDQFFSLKNPLQSTESYPYGQRIPDILDSALGWSGPNGEINHSGGPLMQISEKYARYIGRHSLKFGGDYHRSVGTRNNPQIPDMTYSSLADLLANKPSQVLASLGSGIYSGHMYEFGFFAQDDWRATSKLSLNFGIRYDYYSNFVAEGGEGGARRWVVQSKFPKHGRQVRRWTVSRPFQTIQQRPRQLCPQIRICLQSGWTEQDRYPRRLRPHV